MNDGGVVWEKLVNASDSKMSDVSSSFLIFIFSQELKIRNVIIKLNKVYQILYRKLVNYKH